MRSDTRGEGPMRGIADAGPLAGSLNQSRDSRVMYVANAGEQMMFDLEIQPAQEPGPNRIVSREINRGFDLVHGPLVVHAPGGGIGSWECRILDDVGQLEDGGEGYAVDPGDDCVEEKDHPD